MKINFQKIKEDFGFSRRDRLEKLARFLGTTSMTLNRIDRGTAGENTIRMFKIMITFFYALPEGKRQKKLDLLQDRSFIPDEITDED